jgi:hypothetical protein
MPLTNPVVEPIAATPGLLLLHVPPPPASLKVVVVPTQMVAGPETAGGTEFTFTMVDTWQPVARA